MDNTCGIDVQLRSVTKRFGTLEAVKDVSLDIRNGSFTTILGPSGCGKTTLLRIIGGFERADEGEVLVAGRPVASTPTSQRRTRMVFQNYALFPHMTVQENLAFGLRMQKRPKEEISRRLAQMLNMIGLSDKARSFPREMSGGQQQRVALGRALVTEPTVLLLDEPLGALDLKMRKRMQIELKKLQHDVAITFVYVTHDQEEALALSDQVVVMDQGIIAQVGRPEEVYRNPATPYVADFIGEANLIDGVLLHAYPEGIEIRARDSILWAGRLAGEPPAIGNQVTISVRPDDILVGADPLGTPSLLQGTVAGRTFLGPVTRLTIETAGGLIVNAHARGISALGLGDVAYAGWQSEDAVMLRA